VVLCLERQESLYNLREIQVWVSPSQNSDPSHILLRTRTRKLNDVDSSHSFNKIFTRSYKKNHNL
jgi:hypothetical protein